MIFVFAHVTICKRKKYVAAEKYFALMSSVFAHVTICKRRIVPRLGGVALSLRLQIVCTKLEISGLPVLVYCLCPCVECCDSHD